MTVNHHRTPARNVPFTAVLPYIQYPLPWYSRKSCPHPRYYCGNFIKKSPLPRFSHRLPRYYCSNIPAVALYLRPKGHIYELPRCTLRYIKSHLYHIVFISTGTCNVFILFMLIFIVVLHTLSISTVYMYVCYM